MKAKVKLLTSIQLYENKNLTIHDRLLTFIILDVIFSLDVILIQRTEFSEFVYLTVEY